MRYSFFFFSLFFCALLAQELPPIVNFDAQTYAAGSQNWSISQSVDNKIYVANNSSLLVYNGASWKSYPSPNESIIRSVKVVGNRIYTGCFMEFGYWKEDNLGVVNYTSLSNIIKPKLKKDEQFWNIFDVDNWIVFQSLNCIYLYNTITQKIDQLCFNSNIVKSFKVGNSIFFQKNKAGLFKIEAGKDILVSDDVIVKENKVVAIFKEHHKLLILTENKGFYYLENEQLIRSELLSINDTSRLNIYSSIRLKNKDFVLGTISNGLIYLTPEGIIKYQFNQDKGLQNNTVLSLYEDAALNIWLGLDNGISFINPNSPYKIYKDTEGVLGSVYTAQVFKDLLYLGTNQGLFYRPIHSTESFKLIKGTNGQVWSLDVIDDTLFCGHNSGTFIIKSNKAQLIADIEGTWAVKRLNTTSKNLIQGNYTGLYILQPYENSWEIKEKIKGFDYSSRYFEILGHTIFVNHEYKGVFELQVDTAFSEVKKVTIDTLIKGANSSITKYSGTLLYAYKQGIFKYNIQAKAFEKDSLLSSIYTPKNYESGKLVVHNEDHSLWVFSNTKISKLTPSISAHLKVTDISLDKSKRNSVLGYENIINLNKQGDYLLGMRSGYLILNQQESKVSTFEVFIDNIKKGNIESSRLIDKSNEGSFKSDQNNIEISFFTPKFNSYLDTYYQYQLKGIYNQWSAWSKDSNVKFENLPHGDYSFRVRSKIGNVRSTNTASYNFSILKPWYLTTSMLLVYAFVILVFSLFMHTLYKRYYDYKQQRILLKTKKELELANVQNEKAIIKIKNEQLELENKSKTKELAASTMSMIRKNEVLSSIKKELNKVKDKKSIKPVLQLIDNNLKQNDDWLLFQEAFNNADSDFLKNMKANHPSLTPNDLKLCAYLRLNLSSKKIAQLFNISPRSVEIKRYRLRKKLNLNHEDNLVSYILDS